MIYKECILDEQLNLNLESFGATFFGPEGCGKNIIDEGAKHLNEIERLIKEYNKTEKQCPMRLPNLKIIITGTQFGYKRDVGVLVIPIGCLKD